MGAGILWFQNALLMSLAYFVGLGPVALGFRLLRKPMIDRAPADPKAGSYAVPRTGTAMSMYEAARQF